MAEADACTTLFNSVFMSATVCLTVVSKVASSSASTPEFAWPRATRPMRPKNWDKNAISYSPLRTKVSDELMRAHHVDQQELNAREDVVLIVGAHVLELAEIVQSDRDFAVSDVVKLEM